MVLKENGWSDENTRRAQLDKPVIEKQAACFGFEAIAEDEKSGKVLTHFNSVAEKYDIMNTILSVGTHYIWKHIAIKMLGLNGIQPSLKNIKNHTYPLSRTLNLVTKKKPSGLVQKFINFTQSKQVHDLIKAQYFIQIGS